MIFTLVCLLVSQAPSTPPVVMAGAAPTTVVSSNEVMKAPADEPAEVKAFAQFVDRHLLTLDSSDASQGSYRLRQRDRVFNLKDEDFHEAFTLVPEALELAQKAHDSFRIGGLVTLAGLSASTIGLALVLIAPLLASSVFVPLLVAGLGFNLVALVLVLVGLPFMIAANVHFTSAMGTYNRGLLDLRPRSVPEVPGQVNGGGLTIPLP